MNLYTLATIICLYFITTHVIVPVVTTLFSYLPDELFDDTKRKSAGSGGIIYEAEEDCSLSTNEMLEADEDTLS